MADLIYEVVDGMVEVYAVTSKGMDFISEQHSNNILAAAGGARGLDTRDDADSFDEEMLDEWLDEAKEAGCSVKQV